VHLRTGSENTPNQHDEFPEREFGYGAAVAVRVVEDTDAELVTRGSVDLIDANAKRTHGEEAVRRFKHGTRDARLGSNPEHVYIAQSISEFVLLQRARSGFNLETSLQKVGLGNAADVFKQ